MISNPLDKLRKPDATAQPKARVTPRYGKRFSASGGSSKRRRRSRKSARPAREKKPSALTRRINHWWDRLVGAVYEGNFTGQSAQYLAHRTTRDYILNSAGQAAWGGLFPLLTIVTTQLVGAEKAGVFSMAFVIGTLLLFLANYGVRTYQVSDLDEMQSFWDYQINRFITCGLMMLVGFAYCKLRGYDSTMFSVVMGVLGFRAVDALADVYEGRLQQKDKLYLAGLSQALRCAAAFVAFSVVLLLTRSLVMASYALSIGAIASLVLLTVPLTLFETDRSLPPTLDGIKDLFVQCFPLFLGLFMYNLIDSVPKFAMEGMLSYDNQLYYNAMYFPAHAILMMVGFVYKPQLVRLANIWSDPTRRKRFDLLVLAMFGVIAAITLVTGLFMGWVGIPLLGILYGIDFERFRPLVYIMVATGGVCAAIDFLYQVITVLREQSAVTKLYFVCAAFSVPVALLLVGFSKLEGAVIASLVIMSMLLVLLVVEYGSIRRRLRD